MALCIRYRHIEVQGVTGRVTGDLLIYLGSPYWQLAAFSLVLAFFLDIAAFITGLVIDVADRRKILEK